MNWVDDETLNITNEAPGFPNENRSIELTIGKEIYGESGAACVSWVMKDDMKLVIEPKPELVIISTKRFVLRMLPLYL